MKRMIALTPPQLCDGRIAVAACRAGELGILDLSAAESATALRDAVTQLTALVPEGSLWGVRWDLRFPGMLSMTELRTLPVRPVPWLVLGGCDADSDLASLLHECRTVAANVLLEATSPELAFSAEAAGYDGVILKGCEAGGHTSRSGSFVLLQQVRGKLNIPYWIQGGVGLHTTAAALVAGAEGGALCEQFWLTDESPFSQEAKRLWEALDGSETLCFDVGQENFRCHCGNRRDRARELELLTASGRESPQAILEYLKGCRDGSVVPLGQDIGSAAGLARKYGTVGRILTAIRSCTADHLRRAQGAALFSEGSPLSRLHGTRYPYVQGPMARVSDAPDFLAAVADEGALPFLALSLMVGEPLRRLLRETHEKMKGRPWGVGLLGFVPQEVRREQVKVLAQMPPPFAIIAGGRPSQANELESLGISTYLHVPSPNLLQLFLKDGARKFIFEGKECGGHVGPRTSFVLWEAIVDVLLETDRETRGALQVLFAGGIHDGFSAAMVQAVASPLADTGIKVGLQMGTAYLFTREAVESGAIQAEYQKQVLSCNATVVLESGRGHACRCVKTPFVEEFLSRKRALLQAGETEEKVRRELELLNLGRLQTAAKGLKRGTGADAGRCVAVDEETQRNEGVYMIGQVAELRHEVVTLAQLHRELASGADIHLKRIPDDFESVRRQPQGRRSRDIAIVGMACMFPEATHLREYWQNIVNGVDAIREVGEERWESSRFYSPNRLDPDKTYSKWGGFLRDVAFDPLKYGIPPLSLKSVDPIQLLALETAWNALEDAGFHARGFPRETTATFFGVGGAQDRAISYTFRAMLPHYLNRVKGLPEETIRSIIASLQDELPTWTEDSFPGILDNVVAGRIANRLDLGGGNCTTDAACASSFAALDLGVRQLQVHACDAALVGAVDGTNNLLGYICFSRSQAFSPRGRCRPFDEGADGMVIGEGVAAIVLKRLCDAERDGDRIHAVIKGIGASSDGRNRSLTAPHGAGQVRALRRAYADADVDVSTVELVEAHGTGTAVGDREEIRALMEVFGGEVVETPRCAIGSVKSMIGHTKVAAGMASLIKCALALQHKTLPPTAGVKAPNRAVDFSRSPFTINTGLRPWFRNDEKSPRRAGVSAFGFGGSNFHVVIEEYPGDLRESSTMNFFPRDVEVLHFVRRSREDLEKTLLELTRQLENPRGLPLDSIAHAVHWEECQARRLPLDAGLGCRLALVAGSTADLLEKLKKTLNFLRCPAAENGNGLKVPEGVYLGEGDGEEGKVCFLFPGQGAQKLEMLKDLVVGHPFVHELFERADRILRDHYPKPLSAYIYPHAVFSDQDRARQRGELNDTHVAQPAIGVTSLAALEILSSYGIQADMAAGHSYGENVALHLAGVLSLEDLLKLSQMRGKFSKEACRDNPGTMAAVKADAGMTAKMVSKLGLRVYSANCNGPHQTVVAGAERDVEKAVKAFMNNGVAARRIPVCAPFHSPLMESAGARLQELLEGIPMASPSLPIYSNTTARPYPDSPEEIRELLAEHIQRPVLFEEQIREIHRAGGRFFIEVGPGRTLTELVNRILPDKSHTALSLDGPGRSGWFHLGHLLGRCHAAGMAVCWDHWFRGRRLPRAPLRELLKSAEAAANPPAHIMRLNCHVVEPWEAKGGDRFPKAEGSAAAVKPLPQRSGTEAEIMEKRGRGRGGAPLNEPKTLQQITPPMPRPDARKTEELQPFVEVEPQMRPAAEESGMREARVEAGDVAVPQGATIPAFQSMMQQFIELQRDQQRVMHRFLNLQERVLEGSFGRQESMPSRSRQDELSPSNPGRTVVLAGRVPPAPVLPKLHATGGSGALSPSQQASLPLGGPIRSVEREHSPDSGTHDIIGAALTGTKGLTALSDQDLPSVEAFQKHLLDLVSERTGYPMEMLGLDLHMEADLGIDSIKKVEIFAVMSEHYAALKTLEQDTLLEQLAEVTTLRGIVNWYAGQRAHLLSPSAAPQTRAAAPSPESLQWNSAAGAARSSGEASLPAPGTKMSEASQEAPLCARSSSGSLHVLCVLDQPRLQTQLRELLPDDMRPVFVLPGAGCEQLGPDTFEVDLSSQEFIGEFQESLSRMDKTISGFINLLPLGRLLHGEELAFDAPEMKRFRSLYLLAQAFRRDLLDAAGHGAGWIVYLRGLDGSLGAENQEKGLAADAGALEMLKSLAEEWEGVKVKIIALDASLPAGLLRQQLREELLSAESLLTAGTGPESPELCQSSEGTLHAGV